jgi:P-type conjugative transfer protein TrbJ
MKGGSHVMTRSTFARRSGRAAIAVVAGINLVALPSTSLAGAAAGAATEWTQLANNGQLIDLMKSSGIQVDNQLTQITQLAEQIQNQLNIYKNMLQNTAQLPKQVWGQVESDLGELRDIVNNGQGIAFSMGNADDLLKQRFKSYADLKTSLPNAESFSSTYQTWSDTNRDTIAGTLNAASLTADQFDSEEDTMSELRLMSQSADGQMKALQVGHQIAAQQVAQMQKLRGIVSQQTTMMGTWLQSEQTDKDLAQARREKFFNADIQSIPTGQKMEPRW